MATTSASMAPEAIVFIICAGVVRSSDEWRLCMEARWRGECVQQERGEQS